MATAHESPASSLALQQYLQIFHGSIARRHCAETSNLKRSEPDLDNKDVQEYCLIWAMKRRAAIHHSQQSSRYVCWVPWMLGSCPFLILQTAKCMLCL
mmetsp:Transcript_81565/g.144032  ORF Transcript_81565/g.144032 Transcript_81565/m.144032 type:complete len:98 (+) Transcript_81565:31-324(+)